LLAVNFPANPARDAIAAQATINTGRSGTIRQYLCEKSDVSILIYGYVGWGGIFIPSKLFSRFGGFLGVLQLWIMATPTQQAQELQNEMKQMKNF